MSVEAPQTLPIEATEPVSQLVDSLRANPFIQSRQLVPGVHETVGQTEIMGSTNPNVGIDQSLVAVIDTGGDQFGVVNVTDTIGGQCKTILTHIDKKGDRTTVVDEIKSGMEVSAGRTKDNDYGLQTSRRHFVIGKTDEGELSISDLDSANGTELFAASNIQEVTKATNSLAQGFVRNALRKAVRFKRKSTEPYNQQPDDDFSWSVKSSSLRQLFEAEAKSAAALKAIRADLEPELEDSFEVHRRSAESLFGIAQTLIDEKPEIAAEVQEMIVDGSLFGHEILPAMGKGGIEIDMYRTERLLQIYSKDPELARLLVDRNVAGFHGSSSGTLMGVLKHGLLSANEARNRPGVRLTTGERTYSREGGQRSISFTDLYSTDTINHYAFGKPTSVQEIAGFGRQLSEAAVEQAETAGEDSVLARNARNVASDIQEQIDFMTANPNSIETQLMLENFPVAYGVDIDGYDIYDTYSSVPKTESGKEYIVCRVPSDIEGEFLVKTPSIDPSRLAVIAVPEDKVDAVRELVKLFGHEDTRVTAIEKIAA